MNRKTITSWCLYDFANSFYAALSAVVWQVYYQQRIVGNERGEGDLWWGRIISVSMLLVAVSSPMMGAIADSAGVRKRLMVAYTLVSVGAVGLFTTVQPGMVAWGFLITVVSYVGFEGAIVFYNSYLPEIAPRDHQGRVSGWGFAVGYVGSMLALLIALPLAQRSRYDAVFLATAAAFLLFSLPAFFWLPTDARARMSAGAAARGGVRESWTTFREILGFAATRRFLLSYFFYEDGVNTVIYFAAGFAVQTLGFTTAETITLFLLVQVSALAGAFLWAKPTDRLGPKRVVQVMLVQWCVVVALAFVVQNKMHFWAIAVLAGSGLGAIQAASRAFMSTLTPRGREGEFFGFYSLCGKSAAIMGPILFGEVSRAHGQRLGILSVMVLFIIGSVLVAAVRGGGPTVSPAPGPAVTPSG